MSVIILLSFSLFSSRVERECTVLSSATVLYILYTARTRQQYSNCTHYSHPYCTTKWPVSFIRTVHCTYESWEARRLHAVGVVGLRIGVVAIAAVGTVCNEEAETSKGATTAAAIKRKEKAMAAATTSIAQEVEQKASASAWKDSYYGDLFSVHATRHKGSQS